VDEYFSSHSAAPRPSSIRLIYALARWHAAFARRASLFFTCTARLRHLRARIARGAAKRKRPCVCCDGSPMVSFWCSFANLLSDGAAFRYRACISPAHRHLVKMAAFWRS